MLWLVLLAPGCFLLAMLALAWIEQRVFGSVQVPEDMREAGNTEASPSPPMDPDRVGVYVDAELCARLARLLDVDTNDRAVDAALRALASDHERRLAGNGSRRLPDRSRPPGGLIVNALRRRGGPARPRGTGCA